MGLEKLKGFSNSRQLADIARQVDSTSLLRQFIDKIFQGVGNGLCLTYIGDSKLQGVGASNISKSYASMLFNAINSITNKGKGTGYELNANFTIPPDGFVYGGTTSYGTTGPCGSGHSIVLQPGATITFTRNLKYLELFFYRNTDKGKVELRQDGVLYRTIDCAGAYKLDADSLGSIAQVPNPQISHVYTLTCIDASVELTGVMCWWDNSYNSVFYNRFGVSGTTSSYWNVPATLASIKTVGTIDGRTSVFVIDLGTNDCYQVDGAVSSSVYKTNMDAIISSLVSAGHYVVLTVPPKANESLFPPQLEPYINYVNVIYDLAKTYNLPIVDLSKVDFVGKSLLSDGIHYNDNGHFLVADYYMDLIDIPNNISNITLPALHQLLYNVSAFSVNGDNYEYPIALPSGATLTGVYIKNTVNGCVVPYQDVTDYANNCGITVLKDYPSVGMKLYYPSAGGFCKTGRGALGGLVTNTAANAQIIIEYIL